jgi:acetylornithine/N-succinyldiaminopimelate aminotransferase
MDTVGWANAVDDDIPRIIDEVPGHWSRQLHARMERHATKSYGQNVGLFPVAFASGQGVTLTDVDGNVYLDFTSGALAANIGHAHPNVVEAVALAASEPDSVNGFATVRRVEALEKLASVTPAGMTLLGLFSSALDAQRAALAVARASTGRQRCSSITTGFDVDGEPLAGVLVRVVDERGGEDADDASCGAASRAHDNGALVIVEETGSGFGRFGSWFASSHHDVRPDVMTLGTEIGNGFPVTALAVHEEHAEALEVIVSMSSFGGSPMACAAINAVVDVMQSEQLVDHAAGLGEFARPRLDAVCEGHELLAGVHGRGASFTVDIARLPLHAGDEDPAASIYRAAFERGLATITGPGFIRLAPPIVITTALFARALDILDDAVSAVEKRLAIG